MWRCCLVIQARGFNSVTGGVLDAQASHEERQQRLCRAQELYVCGCGCGCGCGRGCGCGCGCGCGVYYVGASGCTHTRPGDRTGSPPCALPCSATSLSCTSEWKGFDASTPPHRLLGHLSPCPRKHLRDWRRLRLLWRLPMKSVLAWLLPLCSRNARTGKGMGDLSPLGTWTWRQQETVRLVVALALPFQRSCFVVGAAVPTLLSMHA